MRTAGGLHFGVAVWGLGLYRGVWRRPGINPLGASDVDFYVKVAQTAERGLLDAVFITDHCGLDDTWETQPQVASLDPMLALSAVAQATEYIGLVATASTTWQHPWNLARAIQSLDRISHGRAGWNAVTSYSTSGAGLFGMETLPPKEERYARANEFIEVVEGLWRTWSTDSIIADKESGKFARPGSVRPLDHHGQFFDVVGGGVVPPSEQGLPVVFQAGASPEGYDLAARFADATYALTPSRTAALQHRRKLDESSARLRTAGRIPPYSLPGMIVTLGSTDDEARQRHDEFFDAEADASSIAFLARLIGRAPEDLDPDGPLVITAEEFENTLRHTSEGVLRGVQELAEMGKTVREISRGTFGHLTVVGGPETVADLIESYHATGAIDGFILNFNVLEEGLPAFVDEVIPILQQRGLFRTGYTSRTLRGHLGLPEPAW